MQEIAIPHIEWSAPEYIHRERDADFFWTIGLISIAGAIIAVWFADYLFAVFILISGFCLILTTIRHPEEMHFIIDTNGISMGRESFTWKKIKAFHIKTSHPHAKLMILTDKHFLPLYTIALPHDLTSEVHDSLSILIPDTEIEESQSTLLMEKLGF